MRLLFLFLMLPWWSYLALAGGVGWLAYEGHGARSADAAVYLEAIAAEAPAPIDMTFGFVPLTGETGEVVLRAQIDIGRTTELVERNNGIVTSRHLMYVIVPPEATETPRYLTGFIVIPANRKDDFVDWVVERAGSSGAISPIVEIDGLVSTSHHKSRQVRRALANQGFEAAANKFYLTPFLDGRAAGLQDAARSETGMTYVLFGFAAALFAFGAAKGTFFAIGRRAESRPILSEAQAAEMTATPAPDQPAIYGALTPEEEAALTPLQRINRRHALSAAAPVAPAKSRFDFRSANAARSAAPSGAVAPRSRRKADPFDRLREEAARS